MLHDYHNTKVFILIDEYDAPINEAFFTWKDENDIEEVLLLFKSFF